MSDASFDNPPQAFDARSMMSSMPRILHVPCTSVNSVFRQLLHTSFVDIWGRIEREIGGLPDGKGREVAWLSKKLNTRVQVVNNWKLRGVPPKRYADIARALGWSVEDLTGQAPPPPREPWPFEMIKRDRWERLTQRQKGAIESAMLRALAEIEELVESAGPSGKPHRPR